MFSSGSEKACSEVAGDKDNRAYAQIKETEQQKDAKGQDNLIHAISILIFDMSSCFVLY